MYKRAIVLLSGGLDSVLSAKIIIEQKIEVIALHFTSPFSSKKEKEKGLQAERAARELGIRLITIYKGRDYIDVVKSPKHGYGKNMNPCIDCRIFMLKKARDIMVEEHAGFVVTGEVLGQRPMSQRKDTIHIIEKESGLAGLIVRPLSAKHFFPSVPENEGIIDRSRLLDISGRSRHLQYRLAEEFNIKEYGCPGGGCLLTDSMFSHKLKDLFFHNSNYSMQDIELLSIGRHFRLSKDTKLIIGRNETENERLLAKGETPYVLICPSGFKGPTGIIKGTLNDENFSIAASIIGYYAKHHSPEVALELNNGRTKETRVAKTVAIDVNTLKV